ncbi:hypothetical protein BGZ47_002372, partial [Haplosporangium gracile]
MIPTPAPTALPSSSSSSLSTPPDSSHFHHPHHPNKSHHHQQQQQLQQAKEQGNEAWITALFESSADPIVVCDLNGLVCAWSHGAQTTFGIHSKHSLGLSLRHIFSSGSSSPPTPSFSYTSASTSHTSIPGNNDTKSGDDLEIELYPSTPDQVRALQESPLKRVVSRVVGDQSRHIFLESISPVYQQPSAAPLAPAPVSHSSSPHHHTSSSPPPPPPSKPLPPLPPRPHSNSQQQHHHHQYHHNAAAAGTGAGKKSAINGHSSGSHSHTADKDDPSSSITTTTLLPLPPSSSSLPSSKEQLEESTPILSSASLSTAPAPLIVGYSVILTDLSNLSTGPGTNHHPFFASYLQSSMASSTLTSPSPSSTTSSTQTTTSAAPSLPVAADTEAAALSAPFSASAESKEAAVELTTATEATATTTTTMTAAAAATASSAISHQQTQQTHFPPHQTLVKIVSDDATASTGTSTKASWSAASPAATETASAAGTATAENSDNDTDKDDVDSAMTTASSIVALRPSTSREHSTDSGFDERLPSSKPKRNSITAAVVATSIQRGPSPHQMMPLLHLPGHTSPSASSSSAMSSASTLSSTS